MWFNLIKYYITHPEVQWVDFGAGNRGTWKDLVKNREKYMEKMAYKWLYVPRKTKYKKLIKFATVIYLVIYVCMVFVFFIQN